MKKLLDGTNLARPRRSSIFTRQFKIPFAFGKPSSDCSSKSEESTKTVEVLPFSISKNLMNVTSCCMFEISVISSVNNPKHFEFLILLVNPSMIVEERIISISLRAGSDRV